ncbi:MAG: hypothetical protein R6V07_12960 [Armatimonadota bacterium]
MSISTELLPVVLMLSFTATAYAAPPEKDGTLEEFRALPDDASIAGDVLDLPVSVDATGLPESEHYSVHSQYIQLKPDTRYTLGITYRAQGPSLITAGVKWIIGGEPLGLADVDSIRAAWGETDGWRLRALTFRSDHEHTTARIILKAYGGMSLDVRHVRLVEGWYCD